MFTHGLAIPSTNAETLETGIIVILKLDQASTILYFLSV